VIIYKTLHMGTNKRYWKNKKHANFVPLSFQRHKSSKCVSYIRDTVLRVHFPTIFFCLIGVLKLKFLEFTYNQYRSLTLIYRISFERPCSISITSTYRSFNREHAGVTCVSFVAFKEYLRKLSCGRTDRQTNRNH
jgi:hypothetical protein